MRDGPSGSGSSSSGPPAVAAATLPPVGVVLPPELVRQDQQPPAQERDPAGHGAGVDLGDLVLVLVLVLVLALALALRHGDPRQHDERQAEDRCGPESMRDQGGGVLLGHRVYLLVREMGSLRFVSL